MSDLIDRQAAIDVRGKATAKGKKNIIIGYYLHGSERWASGMNSNVIAWMELPDPYQEAVDD